MDDKVILVVNHYEGQSSSDLGQNIKDILAEEEPGYEIVLATSCMSESHGTRAVTNIVTTIVLRWPDKK